MTLNVMGRFVFILSQLLALVLSTGDGLAQTTLLQHSPADVVKRYLTLDQKGARLDALSSMAVESYTSWDGEPAWGHIVVIPVTFHVLGSVYMETAGFVQGAETEEVRFRVKAIKNRWRIVEPMLPPHVGQKRMVNVVREAWLKETDPAKRDRLGSLQGELREAK